MPCWSSNWGVIYRVRAEASSRLLLVIAGMLLSMPRMQSSPQTRGPLETQDKECRDVVTRILRIQAERDRRSDELNRMIDEVEKWEATGEAPPGPTKGAEENDSGVARRREPTPEWVSGLYILSEREGCLMKAVALHRRPWSLTGVGAAVRWTDLMSSNALDINRVEKQVLPCASSARTPLKPERSGFPLKIVVSCRLPRSWLPNSV